MEAVNQRCHGVNPPAFHDTFRMSLRDERKMLCSMASPRRPQSHSPSRSRVDSPSPPRTGRLDPAEKMLSDAFAELRAKAASQVPRDIQAAAAAAAVGRQAEFESMSAARAVQEQAEAEELAEATARAAASPTGTWLPLPRAVSFREALLRKYGSIVGAWRVMDPLEHGRLSYNDFCRASTRLGYMCDAAALWQMLDANQDGFVTIDEIDAELAELLYGFAVVVKEQCKSAERAWKKHFSDSTCGRSCHDQFAKACHKIGYVGDVEAVYKELNVEHTIQGVSYKDFRLLDKLFREMRSETRWNYQVLRPALCALDLRTTRKKN